MKFFHTADWHLGRIFHQVHLTEDQAHILDQVVDLAVGEKVDAVLVAGDLYDRAVPPPEAVALLDSVWEKLVLHHGIPVVAISGNHDSATRIAYGSALLARAGLHLVADLERACRPVRLGGVDVFALPYAEPVEVREWSGDASVQDHASALRVCIERMRTHFSDTRPRILVAHAFVAGMRSSESERPLSVGGAGIVPAELFHDFDYVALGHLHAPQVVSSRCVYSGSPLAYSFSEADDAKAALLVEMDETKKALPRIRSFPLRPRRRLRNLEASLSDAITAAATDPAREDYLRVTLTDEGALLNALGRLREVYPNLLQLERRFLSETGKLASASSSPGRRAQESETALFASFFQEVLGAPPAPAELALFNDALTALLTEEKTLVAASGETGSSTEASA
jgi:exonuclease SbcD